MEEDSAKTAANYVVAVNGSALTATTDYKVQRLDGDKAAIIVLEATKELSNGNVYKVEVKNVMNKDYEVVKEYESDLVVFKDTSAPKVEKVEYVIKADASKVLEIYFNEPIAAGTTAKIDDKGTASAITFAPAYDKDFVGYVGTLTLTGDAIEEGKHSVVLYNVKDHSDNETKIISGLSYTVEKDTTAPKVEKLEQVKGSDTKFKVIFSEIVKPLTTSNFVIKKGTTVIPVGDYAVETAANAKEVVVEITYANLYKDGTKDVTKADLTVEVKEYKDLVDLVGAKTTKTLTMKKGESKPQLEKVLVSGKVVTVKFDKSLDAVANALSSITVSKGSVELAGADIASAVVVDDTPDLVITFGDDVLTNGSYKLLIAKDTVTVKSGTDKNDKIETTFVVSGQQGEEYYDVAAAKITTPEDNLIQIDYDEKMGDSAITKSNYTLDGQALPSEAKVKFLGTAKKVVVIDLTGAKITDNTSKLLTVSKNVKTDDGKIVRLTGTKDELSNIVALVDNVAPEIKSVKFKNISGDKTDTIEIEFNEGMKAATISGDIKIYVENVEEPLTITAAIKVDNDGDKKVTVTLDSAINTNQKVTLNIVEEPTLIKDEVGNLIKGDQEFVIAK